MNILFGCNKMNDNAMVFLAVRGIPPKRIKAIDLKNRFVIS